MYDDNFYEGVIVAILLAWVITVAVLVASRIGYDTLRTQAIQRGFAEYNATNGVWQWKTNSNR